MNLTLRNLPALLVMLPLAIFAQQSTKERAKLANPAPAGSSSSSAPNERVVKEVRHEILTIPQYGVFDFLSFSVNGGIVTLVGDVRLPVTRMNAENAVKQIEGVTKVENQINVLPVFPADDNIRSAVYQAVYGNASLQRYAFQAIPSIHIIVNNGKVRLEGAVANKGDADQALIRARTVPGTFEVTSNLKTDAQLEAEEERRK
ncbi:MAG: BON domain-containing protein [Bryobacteraceae bacterium]